MLRNILKMPLNAAPNSSGKSKTNSLPIFVCKICSCQRHPTSAIDACRCVSLPNAAGFNNVLCYTEWCPTNQIGPVPLRNLTKAECGLSAFCPSCINVTVCFRTSITISGPLRCDANCFMKTLKMYGTPRLGCAPPDR